MKRILYLFAAMVALFSAAIACTKDGLLIDDPYINTVGSLNMYVGDFYVVNCTADPWTAKWTSSNREVATVEGGIISAFTPGSTKITVDPKVGKKTSFTVYVEAVPVTDFKIAESISIYAGSTTYLEVKGIVPENASATSIVWESSDDSIFTVSVEEGSVKITGKSEGTAKLTGSAKDVIRTSTVTVKGPERLSLPASVDAYVNHDVEVSVVQEPEVYTDYSWSIRQEGHICDLRSEGAKAVLTGYAVGKCTLELTLAGGSIKKSCEVTVNTGSLVLDKSESTLIAGDNLTLTATQFPVQYNDYEWVSEDASVATVSGNGSTAVVRAGSKTGATVIRCYLNGRAVSASCRISTYGEDYMDALMFVLVRPNRDPVNLGDNVYVSPDHSDDTELRVITIYNTDLPECFKGRIKWNTGTPSEDSFSTVIKNQNKYREFTVTCSTPVGNKSITYVQGFRELEVREFEKYTSFSTSAIYYGGGWYLWANYYYFDAFYRTIPTRTINLSPIGWEIWAIKPNRSFFVTGLDSYKSGSINIITKDYAISANADGIHTRRDYIRVYYRNEQIVESTSGTWFETNDVTSTKTVDGTLSVNGQSFRIHCYIKP